MHVAKNSRKRTTTDFSCLPSHITLVTGSAAPLGVADTVDAAKNKTPTVPTINPGHLEVGVATSTASLSRQLNATSVTRHTIGSWVGIAVGAAIGAGVGITAVVGATDGTDETVGAGSGDEKCVQSRPLKTPPAAWQLA